MAERLTIVADGFEQTIEKTVAIVGTLPGALDWEMSYEATNRTLGQDEEAVETDTVQWTVTATFRVGGRKQTRRGRATVEPGHSHAVGIQRACVQLLERCGVNTVVINPNDHTDPRDPQGGETP